MGEETLAAPDTARPVSPFSVLLPVYDGDDPAHFRRAVASATRDQTLRPDEVVIVRDGPVRAGLAAALAATAGGADDLGGVRVRVVELARNVGLAAALEAGLRECRHELVARVDADDICLPDRFAVQVPMVDGGLDVVGSAIAEFEDDETAPGVVRVPPLEQAEIARRARFVSPFNHPSVVYRRSAVERAGGYRDLPLMEDYWLFVRMIADGARTANVPEPLVLYRVGAGAYRRRGGLRLLRSEIGLQRRMRRAGFTTWRQCLRNVVVRGSYRLVPQRLRRSGYRRWLRRSARRGGLPETKALA